MTVLINPGAHIADPTGATWTNTLDGARAEAARWLANMRDDVSPDIELVDEDPRECEGRWTFRYRHAVTGATAELETHGISDLEAYQRERIFLPKVYWNGSSCSDPRLSDFAAPGYVMTYRKVEAPEVPAEVGP